MYSIQSKKTYELLQAMKPKQDTENYVNLLRKKNLLLREWRFVEKYKLIWLPTLRW